MDNSAAPRADAACRAGDLRDPPGSPDRALGLAVRGAGTRLIGTAEANSGRQA